MSVAVLADIVGSRSLPDRAAAQRTLDATIGEVEQMLGLPVQALRPTVGDEQQAVFDELHEAMAFTLLLQLSLPEGLECRFGLGIGEVREVESSTATLSDGSGWWAAREAIETVHAMQQRRTPRARAWIVAGSDEDEHVHALADISNAYLLARDELLGPMKARTRRLTRGRCLGLTQRGPALAEGITQPAVSQALAASGAAAVVEGFAALRRTALRHASSRDQATP